MWNHPPRAGAGRCQAAMPCERLPGGGLTWGFQPGAGHAKQPALPCKLVGWPQPTPSMERGPGHATSPAQP
jgi:hypothetical protein